MKKFKVSKSKGLKDWVKGSLLRANVRTLKYIEWDSIGKPHGDAKKQKRHNSTKRRLQHRKARQKRMKGGE